MILTTVGRRASVERQFYSDGADEPLATNSFCFLHSLGSRENFSCQSSGTDPETRHDVHAYIWWDSKRIDIVNSITIRIYAVYLELHLTTGDTKGCQVHRSLLNDGLV